MSALPAYWKTKLTQTKTLRSSLPESVKQILKFSLTRENCRIVLIWTFLEIILSIIKIYQNMTYHISWIIHKSNMERVKSVLLQFWSAILNYTRVLPNGGRLFKTESTDPDAAEELSDDVLPWRVTFVPLRSSDEKN